jgi:dolichyl-phosphate beta-glucosyltransferase
LILISNLDSVKCLIVIPAYCEALRLPPYLKDLATVLAGSPLEVTVRVVDDGSPEKEVEAVQDTVRECAQVYSRIELLRLTPNQGKGAAIRRGWKGSEEYDWLAFLDADGSVPVDEVMRLLAMLGEETPNLIGSRILLMGKTIHRLASRHLMGRLYMSLVSILFPIRVYDSQCGFKLIRSRDYFQIEEQIRESGFCFDVELLLLLHQKSLPVKEIPISWNHIPGSKVRLWRDPFKMLMALIRLRLRFSFSDERA